MSKSNGRHLWRARLPEVEKQCKSCPFLKDNDKEFGAVVNAIKKKNGLPSEEGCNVRESRLNVVFDALLHGDLACHATAYGPNMELQPRSEHRQCIGASKAYKGS